MAKKITRDILESYLSCPYKAHLKVSGEQGHPSDYEILQREARSQMRLVATDLLMGRHRDGEIRRGVTLTRHHLKQGTPLLLDATVEDDTLCVHFDALLKKAGPSRLGDFHYVPVLFHEAEQFRDQQRSLLELYGLILGDLQGKLPTAGLLIYGQNCTIRTIRLNPSEKRAQSVLQEIRTLYGGGTPPQLMLNSHCPLCEFRPRCQVEATAADDLSLLGGLSANEIQKYNRRGIFTVTQLACTFRPPRRSKRATQKSRPRLPAVQALAIRDKKIYVLGTPHLPDAATRIYFDIEGNPERQSAYLLGMIVEGNGKEERHSFWADDSGEELRLFHQFLNVVGPFEDFCLYTYGSYEAAFLRRIVKESGQDDLGEKILASVVNVLSVIHAHVYMPTYSNGLKDISRYLGFSWTAPNASGLQSIVWRKKWEETRLASFKDTLTTYNMEDCAALRLVTECIFRICSDQPSQGSQSTPVADRQVSRVEEINLSSSRAKWGRAEFVVPDLEFVHKRSQFDYERDRVFIRTHKAVKRRRATRRSGKRRRSLRTNRSVVLTSQACPNCGGTEMTKHPHGKLVRLAYDLRFTPSGIRRWITAFSTAWHHCSSCESRFLPQDYLRLDAHFHSLKSWAMYEHVVHRTSFPHVAEKIDDYFGLPINTADVHCFKGLMARYYADTYQRLLDKIAGGAIIHTDETGVQVRGVGKGYVWVFTNQEEVVFMYRPSRESGFLRELFNGFNGVLISDFYSAYDALPFTQQKCHIHLIRDINDDIQAHPWDEDLKAIAAAYGRLLRTIIATVDQFGLRTRHLGKHRGDVERFYRTIGRQAYRSDVAEGYRRRLLEYREKLFTFLDRDDVPWNNNNAERAVKWFAVYRDLADGMFSAAGLDDYLILLSIYVTCRYKELNFLQFLLSQKKDIDVYCANMSDRRRLPTIELCPEGFTNSRRYSSRRFTLAAHASPPPAEAGARLDATPDVDTASTSG
jgi:predicted RecB family nuclease